MPTYLLILRRNQSEELGHPQEEMFARFKQFTQGLHEKGALRAVERLKPAAEGITIRSHCGRIAVEGRYDGSQQDVIGYFLVEAADHDAVLEIAQDCPVLLVGGSVEVRETALFPKQ